MRKTIHRRVTGGITGVLALLCAAGLTVGAGARTAAAQSADVLVVEDDGKILEPANPMPFAGRRVRFVPTSDGGYATTVEPSIPSLTPQAARTGRAVDLGEGTGSVRVELAGAVLLQGRAYRDLYVHPHGAVSLGEPLPAASMASAAHEGDLLRSLAAGPPVVAALWNELFPGRAPAGGGVWVDESAGRVTVSWVLVPSSRPAYAPNTFRITFRPDGTIEFDYGAVAAEWGVVGLSPGRDRTRTNLVDISIGPVIPGGEAGFAWYRDLPALNEMALARRVYRQIPDRFQFLTVFTNRPVASDSLVGSMPVKNTDRGIGKPVFDHSGLFGSRNLEHVILMNDLALWDDDPTRPPRAPAYSFAPSTLAVLAHESGHRWLAQVRTANDRLASDDGHWSFFLDSGGSFLGGNRLRENPDGTFLSEGGLSAFGPLDQYLMGLLPAEEIEPFFVVENATDFSPPLSAAGRAFDALSRPEGGVVFRGTRRDVTIDDVIRTTGERSPAAGAAPHSFRMAFVLVVPAGSGASVVEIDKVERVRRAFGPFFQDATSGRARLGTGLPNGAPTDELGEDSALIAGEPRILGAEVRPRGTGRAAVKLDFADLDGDLVGVEIATDASSPAPPVEAGVVELATGHRRGSLTVNLRDLSPAATEVRVALVDRRGQRSATVVRALPRSGTAVAAAGS